MTIPPGIRAPIEAVQLYKGLEVINPVVAPKMQGAMMSLAEKLIQDGGKILELPATGDNMMTWLEAQPHGQDEKTHAKFLARMSSASNHRTTDKRDEVEIVADFFESFAEARNVAPALAMKMREYVIKAKPETVWQALCACPLIFLQV